MIQMPPLSDLALALTIVGAIFLLRFVFSVRRLRQLSGREAEGSLWQDCARVQETGAFGGYEPERRYAVRQFYIGAIFAGVGVAATGAMLVGDVLTPFFDQAGISIE